MMIKRPSFFGRRKNAIETHPASEATRTEMRGKQGAPSNVLSRDVWPKGKEGRKWGREKSQRGENKPEIGLFYTLRLNIHICINEKLT
jgi:hypothetical protein